MEAEDQLRQALLRFLEVTADPEGLDQRVTLAVDLLGALAEKKCEAVPESLAEGGGPDVPF